MNRLLLLLLPLGMVLSCADSGEKAYLDRGILRSFGPLPEVMAAKDNPVTPPKVALGRRLFHDPRLSAGGQISCATCHPLEHYGADGKPVSEGHAGQAGDRNSPSVYNAAGHFVQFWDGRAATIEEQAKGPILNPVEMAMPSADKVEALLRADPAYREAFAESFPGEESAVNFDNAALAIGAFERTLVTPSRWDAFLQGDAAALSPEEKQGFATFTDAGCPTCHRGVYVGGTMYSRLGIVKSWPDKTDLGRHRVTGHPRDRFVFKVPSLRNVTETAPYLHDGAVETLEETILVMGEYQLGTQLSKKEIREIATWLATLKGVQLAPNS